MISYPWDSIVEAMGDDGFPIYDRDYKAADLQSLNGRIFSNGVFMDEPDSFVVTPAEGMNVILSTGWCCINGTFGNEPNMRELAIQSSASTQDRIDTVVLRWNANIEMRNIDVYVKTGVASDVPVRPTLTRDSTVYELGIADIFVPRGSGAISAARITDTRLQTDRCGAVTPFMQLDTTTFFNQIQAAIDERTAELEEQTAKAVELAQSAIDGTTAGNLQSQIDANKEAIEENETAIESNKATDDERWASLSQDVSDLNSATAVSTAKIVSPNTSSLNLWEARVIRVGRLVICSGVISPKLTGANLSLLTFLGMKPQENAYGAAVQYGGGSGKVYATGDESNCILKFDIPTANVNYTFTVSWLLTG